MKIGLIILVFLFTFPTSTLADGLDIGWKRSIPDAIERCDQYDRQFISAGWKSAWSPTFLKAIAIVESLCIEDAVSSAGAKGLMQLKKVAQDDTGIEGDLFDPDVNIVVGAMYFAELRDRYDYGYMEEVAIGYKEGPTGGRTVVKSGKLFDHIYIRKLTYVLGQLPLVSL